ncbi:hypothetical protein EX30DRAFT_375044 [Ascodesmis nigricans]|uniref:Uncharacterized protein n=1 Tax=Ascodesmis nigricans TaxID=341454 RepID=A0A4S2MJC1_9PEZI|nr:hypothetical protein EX30DRAFT_375044 [Ascodesmis nigricans]
MDASALEHELLWRRVADSSDVARNLDTDIRQEFTSCHQQAKDLWFRINRSDHRAAWQAQLVDELNQFGKRYRLSTGMAIEMYYDLDSPSRVYILDSILGLMQEIAAVIRELTKLGEVISLDDEIHLASHTQPPFFIHNGWRAIRAVQNYMGLAEILMGCYTGFPPPHVTGPGTDNFKIWKQGHDHRKKASSSINRAQPSTPGA